MSRCPTTPKGIAALLLRIAFGGSLLLIGLSHAMTIKVFKGMVAEGLGVLEPLGILWAYILPALMIVGGALFAIGMYTEIATWASGIALASIAIGMLLKPVVGGVDLPVVIPAVVNAFVWLIVFMLVAKCGCKNNE